MSKPLILVTDATGYLGARWVRRLLWAGDHVRCLVRDPDRLMGIERRNQEAARNFAQAATAAGVKLEKTRLDEGDILPLEQRREISESTS